MTVRASKYFPIATKPKVTQADVDRGSIVRYFVKGISKINVVEINAEQYNIFKRNPYYTVVKLPWVLKGNLFPSVMNGIPVLSIEEQNKKILDFYAKRMPELSRKLTNFLEYAIPTINQPPISQERSGYVTDNNMNTDTTTSTSPAPNTEIQADYWWRADSGLTTSSWTASNGGLNFTFTNVTTASSAVGVVFNGTNGFGQTPVLSSNIAATHVLVRLDSLIINTDDALLGGTQNNIHEIAHNAAGYWNIVDATNASTRYGARTTTNIISPMPKVLWFDFETGTNAVKVYTDDNSSIKASMARYTGTYNNLFTWLSGYSMYLGRRQQVSGGSGFMRVNVKELAIFTSSLSYEEVDAFRTEMLARWP